MHFLNGFLSERNDICMLMKRNGDSGWGLNLQWEVV